MKQIILLLVLAGAVIPPLLSAATPLMNAAAREAQNLNGRWHVIVDPFDNGYVNYRLEPFDAAAKPTGGYFLDQKPATPSTLIEYDFDQSPVLNVPGDWNSQNDKLFYYDIAGSLIIFPARATRVSSSILAPPTTRRMFT